MSVDKTKFVRGNNLAVSDFEFDDANNVITVKTDATSSVGMAIAAIPAPTVADASATQAGIVNLVEGQELGAGAKVIHGVRIESAGGSDIYITPPAAASNPSIVIGKSSNDFAGGTGSVVIGNGAHGDGGVAIGYNANSDIGPIGTGLGVAVGYEAQAGGADRVAVGRTAQATNNQATAIGAAAMASGLAATAIGSEAMATHQNSSAFGNTTFTVKDNQVVLGNSVVKTVETYGVYAAKAHVGEAVAISATIDLSKGEYFLCDESNLATTPVNIPQYAFGEPGTGAATCITFVVEVGHSGDPFTFWPGVEWENGAAPTGQLINETWVYGFACLTFSSATLWRGFVLAKNIG